MKRKVFIQQPHKIYILDESKAWLNPLADLECGWLMKGWVEEEGVFIGKAGIAPESSICILTQRKEKMYSS